MKAKYCLFPCVSSEVPFHKTAMFLQLYFTAVTPHFKYVLPEAFSVFFYFSIKNDYSLHTTLKLPRSQIILEGTIWSDIFQVLDVLKEEGNFT
jgi:hypothetical protein